MVIGPSQTEVGGPTFTTGILTMLIIILSVTGVLQGLLPAALNVKVTDPFVMSFGPGV